MRITKVMTNSVRTDGFGAQYQNIILDMCYTEKYNYDFEYTPFKEMDHNYDNDPDFVENKLKFINLQNHYLLTSRKKIRYPHNIYRIIENNIRIVSESKSLKTIKKLFWENKKNKFTQGFNIAIHIRRPNKDDNRIKGTDTSDNIYLHLIQNLRRQYLEKNPKFHIFSQGNEEKFKVFEFCDTELHLDEDLEETFLSLVSADVLITSASSFSYTAAMLSDKEVYYHRFWHPPFPSWKVF